jgi:hypothetical protein
VVLRVTVYLKSGAVATFEAQAVREAAGAGGEAAHPKFRLDFAAPERGGRRLVYLDRDDVSAVVVEEAGAGAAAGPAAGAAAAVAEALGAPAPAGGNLVTVALANAGEAPPGGPPRAP